MKANTKVQSIEHRNCSAIRRNIRTDSSQLQVVQTSFRALARREATLEREIRQLEQERAELLDASRSVPETLPNPYNGVNAPRGPLGALYKILRRLGQILDIRELIDGADRMRRVMEAERELNDRISRRQNQLDSIGASKRDRLVEIRELEQAIEHSFRAHAQFECDGDPFNSFSFNPPKSLKAKLTRG